MLYIVDNGESYSSHEITFTDAPAACLEFVKALCEWKGYELLACAERVTWYEGERAKLSDLIDPDYHTTWEKFPADKVPACVLREVKELLGGKLAREMKSLESPYGRSCSDTHDRAMWLTAHMKTLNHE